MDPERLARSRERAAEILQGSSATSGPTEVTIADLRRRAAPMNTAHLGPVDGGGTDYGDPPLSAVVRLVRELGGELEIVAHLPDGDVRVRPASPAVAPAPAHD